MNPSPNRRRRGTFTPLGVPYECPPPGAQKALPMADPRDAFRRAPPAPLARAVFAGLLALAAVLAGPGDAGATPERGTPSPPGVPKLATFRLSRAEIERELSLELRHPTGEPFEASKELHLEVWLVNRSRARSHAVVLSNDGSELGWREPHAWLSVERQTASGTWEPAPEPPGARCGMYAEDWSKDVITLAPGASRKLEWYRFPAQAQAGDAKRVRVVAHYAYNEGAADKRTPPPRMRAVPAFELASTPLELEVARPLALELTLRGPLPRFGSTPLAPAIDLQVENRSGKPLPFATSDVAVVTFEAELELNSVKTRTIHLSTDAGVLGTARDAIAPGQRRSALAAGAKTQASDGFGLVPPGERVARVRASYLVAFEDGRGGSQRLLWSPWVPVPPAFLPR